MSEWRQMGLSKTLSVHCIYIFSKLCSYLVYVQIFCRWSQERIFKKYSFLSVVYGLSHSLLIWGSLIFMYNLDSGMVLTYTENEVHSLTGFQGLKSNYCHSKN